MRKLVAVSIVGTWLMGLAAPVLAWDDGEIPPGVEKLDRGIVNVAIGGPEEIITHTVGAVVDDGEDTFGGFAASLVSGIIMGTFWGVARIGSGFVDVVTYPFDFNDNRPLVEPDHHI